GWEFLLYCERGRIRVDDVSGAADVWQPGVAEIGGRRPVRWLLTDASTTRGGLHAGIEELVQHVTARRRGDAPAEPLVSPPEAARQVLEILLGVLQSSHRGSTRITFPVQDA